jgi:protocatechuate 3,4-dioxygenase alpha subunit
VSRTPAQTIGPFFAVGLTDAPLVVPDGLWIRGAVRDGRGEPVTDALVETWQAEGFGRCATDERGRYAIRTVKPHPREGEAPHLQVAVFARGLLDRVLTRIYFADEERANAADPVLRALDADARATLLAAPDRDGYRFDIRLQGEGETVFFAS